MINRNYIGWVRDEKGHVIDRPIRLISNAITTMSGGGHVGKDGLGNTTPHIVYEFT